MQRNAAAKVDWTRLSSSLGLRGNTLNSLTAFKKRHDDAKRRLQQLEAQSVDVDFASYRSTLKNQSIVDEIEKAVKGYQVKKVDVSRQIKAIESFEATAIKSAEETKGQVEKELKDLEATLQNIQGARPFEDLTVVCAGKDSRHASSACMVVHGALLTARDRMKSWLLSLRSRSAWRRWCQTTDGCLRDTRYVKQVDMVA